MKKVYAATLAILMLVGCSASESTLEEQTVTSEGITTSVEEMTTYKEKTVFEKIDIPSCFKYTIDNHKYIITGYTGSESVVTIPEGVYAIGSGAFKVNTTITKVVLPKSLIEIGTRAFNSCYNLTEINFPENLRIIMDSAFAYSGIEHAVLPDSLEYIGERAFAATNISEIILPDKLENLGPSTFQYCASLKEIELPSNLKSIGEDCFSSTGIKNIVIPEGCERIEDYAFMGSSNLQIYLPSTITYFGKYVFGVENSPYTKNLKVYVPTYNPALKNIAIYGPNAIVYTEDTDLDKFYRLSEIFVKRLHIDMNFDGFPELLYLDSGNIGSIYYLDNNIMSKSTLYANGYNSFYIGDDMRTLTHCRSADEEFYILTSVNESEDISARTLKISVYNNNTYSIDELGSQEYFVYDENGAEVSIVAKQHIGGSFGVLSQRVSKSELKEILYSSYISTLNEYLEQYEILEEYELDEYFEIYENGETPSNINLGEFSNTKSGTNNCAINYVLISGRKYNSESNKIEIFTGKCQPEIDFNTLSSFSNLTYLYIDAGTTTDLSGIETLSGLCEVKINIRNNENIINLDKLTAMSEVKVITLIGCATDYNFGTGYTKVDKGGNTVFIKN